MLQSTLDTGVKVVQIEGEFLDASNVKEFKQELAAIVQEPSSSQLAIDFSKVEFVDSSGLGAILCCLRTMNTQGGELRVFQLSPPVQSLFELVRMHKVLDICGTKEEALASFSRRTVA